MIISRVCGKEQKNLDNYYKNRIVEDVAKIVFRPSGWEDLRQSILLCLPIVLFLQGSIPVMAELYLEIKR